MALSVVQAVSASGTSVTSITTANITTSSGNLLVADLSYYGVFSSFADSKTNTWSESIAELTNASDANAHQRQRYVANCTGGASHNFTLTLSASGYPTVAVREVSGAALASVLDQTASAQDDDNGTSHTSGSTGTTTQSDEILCGAGSSAGNTDYTQGGSGWTADTNISTSASTQGMIAGYKIIASTGTHAYEFTTSATARCTRLIATFKGDGTPATQAPRSEHQFRLRRT